MGKERIKRDNAEIAGKWDETGRDEEGMWKKMKRRES